jgi:hypothetical protein
MTRAPTTLALLLVAGCAQDRVASPSLALRPAELRGFEEPVRSALPAPTVDAAGAAQAAALGGQLDALVKSFDADQARAERAAAVPGARTVGGDAWIAAQQALAALDDWRAQTGGLAIEIDDAARARIEATGAADPALAALSARIATEATRQSDAITALAAKLPQP